MRRVKSSWGICRRQKSSIPSVRFVQCYSEGCTTTESAIGHLMRGPFPSPSPAHRQRSGRQRQSPSPGTRQSPRRASSSRPALFASALARVMSGHVRSGTRGFTLKLLTIKLLRRPLSPRLLHRTPLVDRLPRVVVACARRNDQAAPAQQLTHVRPWDATYTVLALRRLAMDRGLFMGDDQISNATKEGRSADLGEANKPSCLWCKVEVR